MTEMTQNDFLIEVHRGIPLRIKYSLKRQHKEVEKVEILFFIDRALQRDWKSAVEEKQQLIKNCRNSQVYLVVAT